MSSSPLVWVITGTSFVPLRVLGSYISIAANASIHRTGLGRLLTVAALERGDKVIATARAQSMDLLDDLRSKGADTLELDVTDSAENLNAVAKAAVALYGRIDVVVNNAGYLLVGAIEENTLVPFPSQHRD